MTGEVRFTDSGGDVVVTVECADTDTDGVVILGGEVTDVERRRRHLGELVALFIREGDPDSVAVWLDEGENADRAASSSRIRHDVLDDDSAFVDVEAGSDIETG